MSDTLCCGLPSATFQCLNGSALTLLPLVELRAPPAALPVVVHRPLPERRQVERDQRLVRLRGQIGLQHHLQAGLSILQHQHLRDWLRLALDTQHAADQALEALGDVLSSGGPETAQEGVQRQRGQH